MRKLYFVVVTVLAMLLAQSVYAADAKASAGPTTHWFVVIVKHSDSVGTADPAVLQQAMAGHMKYLGELYDKGELYMAGPFMDDSQLGIGIVQADSAATVQAAMEQDPAFKAGLFTISGVHPWFAAFNKADGMRMTPEMMAQMMSGAPMPTGHGGASASGGSSATTASGGGDMPAMTAGAINFIEFPSKNVQESQAFYSKLFGWEFNPMPADTPEQTAAMANSFLMFSGPGGTMGAFSTMYKPTTDGPVVYINCNGVKATLAQIEAAGGKTAMGSMKLPADWGYIGTFTDPHGNVVGLWSTVE